MFHEKTPQLLKIIEQLKSILDLCYVFESKLRSHEEVQPILIIIHKSKDTDTRHKDEIISKINPIFKTNPSYTYIIYTLEYALTSIKECNLFFIQHCNKENIIYHSKGAKLEDIEVEVSRKTFGLISQQIEDELKSCFHHFDAATLHTENMHFGKALVSIYLYQSSLLHIAAKFYLGEEFEEDSISELLDRLLSFDKSMNTAYDIHSEKDRRLLKILDKLPEYSLSVPKTITEEEAKELLTKASNTLVAAKELLRSQLKAAILNYEKQDKSKSKSVKKTNKEYRKIREDLQNLVNRRTMDLRPGHHKTYYKAAFKIEGAADILYHISGMLKVCVMALENEHTNQFPNPNLNIQTTLEHILQLLPFEEVECLERIIKELEITTEDYVLEPPVHAYF